MLRLATAIAASMLIATAPVLALSGLIVWMSESELNLAFSGKTIDGHYADGGTFVETYGGDGRIAYKDERRSQVGHWSVRAGTFCTIYDIDPTGGCFRVHKVSDNCFEFYFAARTEEQAQERRTDKPSWTARAWIKDTPSTCTDHVGV